MTKHLENFINSVYFFNLSIKLNLKYKIKLQKGKNYDNLNCLHLKIKLQTENILCINV